MARKLDNYLRMYRKRSGLSQHEVAFLLGWETGTLVSRYERGTQRPSLDTVFAYEAAFGVPTHELFAGIFQKVEDNIKKRAQVLARKLSAATPSQNANRKLDLLNNLASGPVSVPVRKV